MQNITDFKKLLKDNAPAVVFTGAGISEESGIPTFRTGSALWEKYNPEECCTITALIDHPEKVWALINEMKITCDQAEPNEAHKIISQLQKENLISSIITQNVDELHQKSGSQHVLHIHGTLDFKRCENCGTHCVKIETMPPECHCCATEVRPDIVLFGDDLPYAFDQAMMLANTCRMMIVIGTSGLVEPAAEIPRIASMRGIPIVEINPEPAGFAPPRFTIEEKATIGMQRFL